MTTMMMLMALLPLKPFAGKWRATSSPIMTGSKPCHDTVTWAAVCSTTTAPPLLLLTSPSPWP